MVSDLVSLVQSGTVPERNHGTLFACMTLHMLVSQFSVAGRCYRWAEVYIQFGFAPIAPISTSTTKLGAYIILIPTKMKCILTQLGRARVQNSAGQGWAVCSGDHDRSFSKVLSFVTAICSKTDVNRSVYWKEASLIAGALFSSTTCKRLTELSN